jgi:hypothetical protein
MALSYPNTLRTTPACQHRQDRRTCVGGHSQQGGFKTQKRSEKAKQDGRDRKARPAANAEGRLAIRKTKDSPEQAHGTAVLAAD